MAERLSETIEKKIVDKFQQANSFISSFADQMNSRPLPLTSRTFFQRVYKKIQPELDKILGLNSMDYIDVVAKMGKNETFTIEIRFKDQEAMARLRKALEMRFREADNK